ncbi:MAG: hypothetical protein DMF50_00270 [Acidobacteria bacterium]|nr:MAG: hypothetical protein DMF50_00270 [Acidobacteriota bacterium]
MRRAGAWGRLSNASNTLSIPCSTMRSGMPASRQAPIRAQSRGDRIIGALRRRTNSSSMAR